MEGKQRSPIDNCPSVRMPLWMTTNDNKGNSNSDSGNDDNNNSGSGSSGKEDIGSDTKTTIN